MKNLGLIFFRDNDSGIAKINVTDTYTGIKLVDNQLVDLFQKDQASASGQYEEFIFWVTLPHDEENRYLWTVDHSGYNNPAAVGPGYDILYNGFVLQEQEVPASIKKTIILIDKENMLEYEFAEEGVEYNSAEYRYEIQTEITKKLYITTTYTGDNSTVLFKLGNPMLRCFKFVRFSVDNGVTWRYPYDLGISWGSNVPDYDDEKINADGEFWVEFVGAPADKAMLKFDVLPVFDHARIEIQINQPGDASYMNYAYPVCITDYVAEFKK